MALMFPSDVQDFTTPGEAVVYGFLRDVPKPDDKYLAWYSPDLNGLEPDFLLFSHEVGLVVLEVKDWALDQIEQATPDSVTLRAGDNDRSQRNPLRQAREYGITLLTLIQKDGRLTSNDPLHYGKCRIPVGWGMVFPNINKYEFEQSGLSRVMDTQKAFFWDDLIPQSDMCSDPSGHQFALALRERFAPPFLVRLSSKELEHLRGLLFPVVRIQIPERGHIRELAAHEERIRCLDHNQEDIARRCTRGHHIVVGPSGSGKTLVLVHRAALLLKNHGIKRILFVCYNITLTNYILRLLAAQGIPLGPTGVEVLHFYELCSKILGEDIAYEHEDGEYYDLVAAEAAERAASLEEKYDAVLVDEGQDFSLPMLTTVLNVLAPDSNHLMIGLDEGQAIYQRNKALEKSGISASATFHRLKYSYRSTVELSTCAERFLNPKSKENASLPHAPLLLHGPQPEFVQCADFPEACAVVADRVKKLLEEGYPASEIAVLYASTKDQDGNNLPYLITQNLQSRGVLSIWASEDYRAKRDYDVSTQRVTVSTIHSAKGLDYACVFLLGLDILDAKTMAKEQKKKLAYVGLTRARYFLLVPYVQNCPLIRRIHKS